MMKNLLLSAIVLLVSATAAHAGDPPTWSWDPTTNDGPVRVIYPGLGDAADIRDINDAIWHCVDHIEALLSHGTLTNSLSLNTNDIVQVDDIEGVSPSTSYITNFTYHGNGSGLTNMSGTEIRSGTVADARIASTITRDTEWDTMAEINAASTDTDAVLDTDIGSTVQAYDAQLADLADGDITGNFVNTNNPWADNEVSDTLTVTGYMQDGDINTFSELQAWVSDKTLVNEEDVFTIDANWVNTANPWADNEVADNITASSYLPLAGGTMSGNITMADDGWIGLGASSGRIEFDNQTTNEINFLNCKVGIGTNAPSNRQCMMHVVFTNTGEGSAVMIDGGGESKTQLRLRADDENDRADLQMLSERLNITSYDDGATNWLPIRLNASVIDFYTAGTQRMYVAAAGNVGIGTATPATKLDVNGSFFGRSTAIWSNAADSTTSFQIFDADGGTPVVCVDTTNERMGIGTATPGAPLDVWASAAGIRFTDSDSSTRYHEFTSAGNVGLQIGADVGNNGAGSFITFRVDNNEKVRIADDGDVGIGTNAPGAKLHVEQSAAADAFRVNDAAGDTTPFVISQAGNVGIGMAAPTSKLEVNGILEVIKDGGNDTLQITAFTDGNTYFSAFGAGGAGEGGIILRGNSDNTVLMTLEPDGDVCVGTGSPATQLEVEGALTLQERTSQPSDPAEGHCVIWLTDGTGYGDDGDLCIITQAGGVLYTNTIVDVVP